MKIGKPVDNLVAGEVYDNLYVLAMSRKMDNIVSIGLYLRIDNAIWERVLTSVGNLAIRLVL